MLVTIDYCVMYHVLNYHTLQKSQKIPTMLQINYMWPTWNWPSFLMCRHTRIRVRICFIWPNKCQHKAWVNKIAQKQCLKVVCYVSYALYSWSTASSCVWKETFGFTTLYGQCKLPPFCNKSSITSDSGEIVFNRAYWPNIIQNGSSIDGKSQND